MWLQHWSLSRNPFLDRDTLFVATPVHLEAVARLVSAIESGEPLVSITSPAGLGKTRVVAQAFSMARNASTRLVWVSAAATVGSLAASLAERLGARARGTTDAGTGWRALREALLLCHWQRQAVVAAIDDAHLIGDSQTQLELDRLAHGGPCPEARLRLIVAGRPCEGGSSWGERRGLDLRLKPLTRGEAADFIKAKLASAGRTQETFSGRAITLLHAQSGGVPRTLDCLAAAALAAGANEGADFLVPELLEKLSREFAVIEV
jgi:general secretion pathway protein A